MLNAAGANALVLAMNTEFAEIGTFGDTKMPRSKKNTEPAAYEYHVASHLAGVAVARKEKAHKQCVRLGIIFDHKEHPLPVGTDTLVYPGDVVEISVKVGTPTTKVDMVALGVWLAKKCGLTVAQIEKAFLGCTIDNAAPHKFTSSLITAS